MIGILSRDEDRISVVTKQLSGKFADCFRSRAIDPLTLGVLHEYIELLVGRSLRKQMPNCFSELPEIKEPLNSYCTGLPRSNVGSKGGLSPGFTLVKFKQFEWMPAHHIRQIIFDPLGFN